MRRFALGLVVSLLAPAAALAQATVPITLQGRLTGEAPADGQHALTLRVWESAAGGTPVSVPFQAAVSGGVFSATIDVPLSAFEGADRWWSVVTPGGAETPRERIAAVPAAVGAQRLQRSGEALRVDLAGNALRLQRPAEGGTFEQWAIGLTSFAASRVGLGIRNLDRAHPAGSTNWVFIDQRTGAVGIGTDEPAAELDVAGTTRTRVLTITGGADLAEKLSVSDPDPSDAHGVVPGMLVSIDPAGARRFKLADEPYDRRRVGIISGGNGVAAGLVLHHEGNPAADGEHAVALTGQVWAYADAGANGAIAPGDLLTTSSTPGHAMRATDLDRARFAVVGQALTPLERGRGWVQVLVGKQ